LGGAAAVMTGRYLSAEERTAMAIATLPPQAKESTPPLAADLNVVKKGQGPVLTTVDEFYKVGPGPPSSHTIGPMRITCDFYQQTAKLPADRLARATKLQVNSFGSLSATGKGHGTERAALAGLVGKEPATVDPKFLDSLRDKPDQVFPVKLGAKGLNYLVFVGNGLNTLHISASKIDTHLVGSGSVWWEPLGPYREPGKSRNMYDDYYSSKTPAFDLAPRLRDPARTVF
jgi:serine dehydratase beta subunit